MDLQYPIILPENFPGWVTELALINLPSIYSIVRTGSTKVRNPAPVFHPAQQQCSSILQQSCASIEYTINRVWPIIGSKYRIKFIAVKKLCMLIVHFNSTSIDKCVCSDKRNSSNDCKNAKVDSAPWFSLGRSECRPSRQPPVVGS